MAPTPIGDHRTRRAKGGRGISGMSGAGWRIFFQALRERPDEREVPAPEGTFKLTRLGMKVVAFDTQFPPETNREHRRVRVNTSLVPWEPTREVAFCHVGRMETKKGMEHGIGRAARRRDSCPFHSQFQCIGVHQILCSMCFANASKFQGYLL